MAKIDRKKLLKEPDEFLTLSDRAVRWARTHTRPLTIGVCAALAGMILVLGIQAYLNHRQAQGAQAQELYRALVGQDKDLTVSQMARQRLVALGVAPENLPAPAAGQ